MGGSRKGTRVGKQGVSMGARETSPAARRRYAKRMQAEEARWAALAGPVTVRQIEPAEKVDEEMPAERVVPAPRAGIRLGLPDLE